MNREQELVRNLRSRPKTVLRILRGAHKRLRSGENRALCSACINSAAYVQDPEGVLEQLLNLIRLRLGRYAWLEEWLAHEHGRPYNIGLGGWNLKADPELIPTRLAWVDSLIKELCE